MIRLSYCISPWQAYQRCYRLTSLRHLYSRSGGTARYGPSSSRVAGYMAGAAMVFNIATGARTAILQPKLHGSTSRDVRD
jgi:hypothetical protein